MLFLTCIMEEQGNGDDDAVDYVLKAMQLYVMCKNN